MAEPRNEQRRESDAGFHLQLSNFNGPFDLLLTLIGNHKLDITEVALAQVTDEFLAYLRQRLADNTQEALDEASEFLVVAATLLDLKAARLLPAGEVEDAEDIAALEARDLLFARLLQYKAFKELAQHLAGLVGQSQNYVARSVPLDPPFDAVLPELIVNTTPEQLAAIARSVFERESAPPPQVGVDHLHHPKVSVPERAELMMAHLKEHGRATFSELCPRGGDDWQEYVATVVASFLALLELFRDRHIDLHQEDSGTELTVSLLVEEESS
ncbi:segregation and condensation protein A [Micrococcoides hystricis]|uniref:Segregation and condensation protein A n=1 Tax=Micrococcoides hystricis TaxID=1572761 RepID=A0ABV6P8V4_9MICC